MAQEVAAATAAVTAEIEQKLTEDADTYQFPHYPAAGEPGGKLCRDRRRAAEQLPPPGGVRIAPIPDKISVVGIEVPNKLVTPVLIQDVIESREFTSTSPKVAFAVGKGHRRPEHRGQHRQAAPPADRRHHRLRQVGVHQLPDHLPAVQGHPRRRSASSWWTPRWWSWPPTTASPTC